MKGRQRRKSSLFPIRQRLTQSENDLSPKRVNPKSSFTILDSTAEASNNSRRALRLNLRGVKNFISRNGGNEQLYKPNSCQKSRGCHNHAPSSYSSHHLLQTPEVIDEEIMLNSYPERATRTDLEDKDTTNVAEVINGHATDYKESNIEKDFRCDPDIQSKG